MDSASTDTPNTVYATISRHVDIRMCSLLPRHLHERFFTGLLTLLTFLLARTWLLALLKSFVNTSDSSGKLCLGFRMPIVCCISCTAHIRRCFCSRVDKFISSWKKLSNDLASKINSFQAAQLLKNRVRPIMVSGIGRYLPVSVCIGICQYLFKHRRRYQ